MVCACRKVAPGRVFRCGNGWHRALGTVDSLTQTCRQGLGAIATELKRRGYDDSDFMHYYSQWYQSEKPQLLCSDMNALVERTLADLREKSLAISEGIDD